MTVLLAWAVGLVVEGLAAVEKVAAKVAADWAAGAWAAAGWVVAGLVAVVVEVPGSTPTRRTQGS